ncbi:sucrose-6-phosphate hydrolase [Clostridium sp. Maddingley MBC34-26]|nr:sucrose-6-phosphate hydrolase [Clostridium sp. Maddingley MBC34-26]EKQ54394.1 MAG: sucrose-6-phosphate hydrolase [Clostridium sp. Maddingley MBC34-26]
MYKDPKYKTIFEATEKELEILKSKSVNDPWKPIYHIHPECGLLNDPNGLAYYNGKYHVFHQWYPFGVIHGMKHWAHLESTDLANWTRQSVALVPIESYESHGAYSGNSIKVGEDLYLYYTGNIKYDEERRSATQCLAIMNKHGEIKKYEKNPVISHIPDGYTGHVRDPKVFKKNGIYYMILGAQRVNRTGTFIMYKSNDGFDWNLLGELKMLNFDDEETYMWECPDYVNIDGKDVMIFSPQGLKPEGDRYNNIFNVVYTIGTLDIGNLTFSVESCQELDRGFDFYATQSFSDKNEGKIMFAWAGQGEFKYPTDKNMWAHCLTFPRRLNLKNGILIQNPSSALELLKEKTTLDKGAFEGKKVIKSGNNTYHLKAILNIEKANKFGFNLFSSNEEKLIIEFDKENQKVKLDRSQLNNKFAEDYGMIRQAECNFKDTIELEILVDNSIVEIFINGGEVVMTTRAFPLDNSTNIELFGDYEIKYECSKSTLKASIK